MFEPQNGPLLPLREDPATELRPSDPRLPSQGWISGRDQERCRKHFRLQYGGKIVVHRQAATKQIFLLVSRGPIKDLKGRIPRPRVLAQW